MSQGNQAPTPEAPCPRALAESMKHSREQPCSLQLEKAHIQQQGPSTSKKKKKKPKQNRKLSVKSTTSIKSFCILGFFLNCRSGTELQIYINFWTCKNLQIETGCKVEGENSVGKKASVRCNHVAKSITGISQISGKSWSV